MLGQKGKVGQFVLEPKSLKPSNPLQVLPRRHFPTSQTIKLVFLPLNHMMAWQEEEDNSWATKVRFMSQCRNTKIRHKLAHVTKRELAR